MTSIPTRRVGFITSIAALTCSRGHAIERLCADCGLACSAASEDDTTVCDARLYLLCLPAVGKRRRWWAADVVRAELEYFELQRFTIDGVLAYFGAAFPTINARARDCESTTVGLAVT
jgi:hypothetical protein